MSNMYEIADEDEPDEFYFESDHLALKGNKDYLSLMKTLAVLQAQRSRALKDLDSLQRVKQRALEEPEEFLSILRSGGDLGVPNRQVIAEVPSVDWAEYNASLPSGLTQPSTRSSVVTTTVKMPARARKESELDSKGGKLTVRGRTFDQTKPETFNQLWTADEQRRLEELLIEFPPEEVESRRFKKIAEALGNRTRMQVSSRVQKYFLKLMKAGLPVPGRAPRASSEAMKKGSHSRQRGNFLSRPTTFFPQHQDLPVYMPEGEDIEESASYTENVSGIKCEPLDDSLTDEERKLSLLQQVRKDIENGSSKGGIHHGFKCDLCEEEPISGTRWHCLDCPTHLSTDFCSDCVVSQLDSAAPHPLFHRIEAVHAVLQASTESTCDPDYLPQSFSKSYNYLDPNFLPH